MSEVVSYRVTEGIAVITIDNPPVNAMGHATRQGVWDAVERFSADADAAAAVLICAGRTFIAGADISEFDKPPQDPWLPEVVQKLEDAPKPVVAAIHGTALGGGLETALGCHFRCAVPSARLGFPEVNLGLLPGASGTQRLPRVAGVRRALDLMISGKPVSAPEALDCGIIDHIVDGDLLEGAIACARRLAGDPSSLRRISTLAVDDPEAGEQLFHEYRKGIAQQTRGFLAPGHIVRCVEAAVKLDYAAGLTLERRLFDECRNSPQSKAQRYLFFAEREVGKIPDVPKDTPVRRIDKAAVVGAGTMGSGIAMNFAAAGIPVTLVEQNREALDRGLGTIRRNYESAVKKGRMSEAGLRETMDLIRPAVDMEVLADADLVVEAVFEEMGVKKDVFTRLDRVCRDGAILASNTSSLDLNAIAAVTGRPADVIGLHFFAPANVMPLLEIVRGEATAVDVIATAMSIAKRIRKTGVLVGVCFGFVGNRMFFPYVREAQTMMLAGATPERIDAVMYDWGMAMGPAAVMDLSGIDVFYRLFNEWQDRPEDPAFCRLVETLFQKGRLGQKSGAGFYRYEGRERYPDPELMETARAEAAALGIEPQDIDNVEITERLLYSMINEGARILEEGIALRPGDIDVIYANGYGFPRYRGGPMFYADSIGLDKVHESICAFRDRFGDRYWTPAPLLEQLAREGSTFGEWSRN